MSHGDSNLWNFEGKRGRGEEGRRGGGEEGRRGGGEEGRRGRGEEGRRAGELPSSGETGDTLDTSFAGLNSRSCCCLQILPKTFA